MVCNKDTCLIFNSLIIIYVCNCGSLGYYKCNIYCLSICQLYGRIWLQRVQGLPREENIPPINCRGQKFQVMFLVCSGGYDNFELFYSRDGISVHLWTGGVMVLDIVFNVSDSNQSWYNWDVLNSTSDRGRTPSSTVDI